jgi:hypothetical protein
MVEKVPTSSIWVTTSGPLALRTLVVILVCWTIMALVTSTFIQQFYVENSTSEIERNNRVQNVQLWVGHSGFIGTTVTVAVVIAVVFLTVYVAFYCKLISIDIGTISMYIRSFGDRFISAVRRYRFLDEFLKIL